MIKQIDDQIGRITTYLEETNQLDNTLIVLTADHGEMLGDYGMWGKRSFHDATFHVPLIIRDPERRAAAGRVVDEPTESVDVTPTILEWIGAKRPQGMDGHELTPFLNGDSPEGWRTYSFSELDLGDPANPTKMQQSLGLDLKEAKMAVLRDNRHRFVQFSGDLPQILLDLDRPNGSQDVSGHADAMPILLDLSRKMLCHRMRYAEGTFENTVSTPDGMITAPT